ncbi:MAG: alcohol dehydrogenase catalytic domain-containing protein [Armatimonas sp.]
MKAVEIVGVKEAQIVERPDPTPIGNLVRVRTTVIPMCTEVKGWLGGWKSANLGHEAAGVVEELGPDAKGLEIGQRVVVMPQYPCGTCGLCESGEYIHCTHVQLPPEGTATYAEALLKPDWLLLPIPYGIPTEHAAMACCGLGPTFGALERAGAQSGDTIAITGLGPVGLGGVVNAVHRGCRVIGIESHPYRANLARELGAVAVIDPTQPDAPQRLQTFAPSIGIDCSGVAPAQRLLIEGIRRRGQIVFVGEAGDLTLNISNDMLRRGLTLHGQWHYPLGLYEKLMAQIATLGPQIEKLITHRFPLERVEDSFAIQATGNCGKVILLP